MTQPTLNIDEFAFLLRRVSGATSLTIFDHTDTTVFAVGDPVELDGIAAHVRELPTGQVTVVEDLPDRLGGLAELGDWILVEPTGPQSELLMLIIAPGEPPEGEAAAALDLVLHGAKERKEIISEMEHLAEVLRREAADSLLETIARAQSEFILDGDPREVFARLLDDVLALTGSEFGFIGEIEPGTDGEPLVDIWASTNVAWTDQLRAWSDDVVRTRAPVVARTSSLDDFLGLPFLRGERLVGMVGLANRPDGYDDELITRLEPFLTTCSALIEALRVRHEREESEERLRISEARTSAILESVVDAVVVTDEKGRIDTFNESAERTFGYRAAEVLGRDLTILLDDETGVDELLTPGIRRETTGVHKTASPFPLELSVSEVEIGTGRLFAVTCRDLTAEHRAERDIRMYAATMEATPDFVGVARVGSGELLAVNAAGRRTIGLGEQRSLEDLRIDDVYAPRSRDHVRDVGLPAAIRDGSWTGETSFVDHEGHEIPMSQVIVVSKDAHGVPQLLSTIARDISERKEIERVKSEFVSTVSHELRTPLTSIRGSLGLLAGGVLGELPPKATEMVELAQTNTERLIRLVNNILDFEKAQAGGLEVHFDEVDTLEVVGTAVAAVRGAAIEAGVEIELDAPGEGLPALEGDTDRLVQILVNLLGNALKFSSSGERIVLSVGLSDTGATQFSVTDHGPGIAPPDLDAIFEPFHQVDSSDRRAVGGSGLGLAIAKSIAEAHGGHIFVESELGVGSTFTLVVPPAQPSTSAARAPSTGDRPDVLIADDDASTRVLVRRLLGESDLTFVDATTGHDVLHRVRHLDPRLLVLDVGLPGIDGFEIVEHLRRDGFDQLPIVVFTGRDLSSDERALLALGPTRHLTKSRSGHADLVAAIHDLLGAPRAEAV